MKIQIIFFSLLNLLLLTGWFLSVYYHSVSECGKSIADFSVSFPYTGCVTGLQKPKFFSGGSDKSCVSEVSLDFNNDPYICICIPISVSL